MAKYSMDWENGASPELIASFSTGPAIQGLDYIPGDDSYLMVQFAAGRKSVLRVHLDWVAGAISTVTTLQATTSVTLSYRGVSFSQTGPFLMQESPRANDYLVYWQLSTTIPVTATLFREDTAGNQLRSILSTTGEYWGAEINDATGDIFVTKRAASDVIEVYDATGTLKYGRASTSTNPGDLFFDGLNLWLADTAGSTIMMLDTRTFAVKKQSAALSFAPLSICSDGQYLIVGG